MKVGLNIICLSILWKEELRSELELSPPLEISVKWVAPPLVFMLEMALMIVEVEMMLPAEDGENNSGPFSPTM